MATIPALPAAETLPALTPEAERFSIRQRQARMFASSPLVPEHLRKGPPDQALANCYIALTLAEAMGEVPLIVMQNIHVVNGKAGFASQYMIARANASGIFKDCIDWEIAGEGKALKVTAFGTLAKTGRRVEISVDMGMAEAEGWTKNPKYRTMPEVMLRYRSAAFLVRFYAPQVMLGYRTIEEVEDVVSAGMAIAEPLTGAALIEQAQIEAPTEISPAAAGLEADEAEPTPQAEEAAASAEGPTLAERMSNNAKGGVAGRDPDVPAFLQEGPADEDRGEKPTLEQAKAEIDGAELVPDVDARVKAFEGLLSDEDMDALRSHAIDKIAALGGSR